MPYKLMSPHLPRPRDIFTKVKKLTKSVYGLKDAGCTRDYSFIKCDWKQFSIDECLYIKQGIHLVLYIDDICIISPNKQMIQNEMKLLQYD